MSGWWLVLALVWGAAGWAFAWNQNRYWGETIEHARAALDGWDEAIDAKRDAERRLRKCQGTHDEDTAS
ncbi:hypothetical protein PO878_04140 [Iamia majanohamensis]|uniref:Uncharacterized protein n=1 Tax=Iamia majanohamensis TaxID=467976 RepID=A0AAF0BWD0_9ACTN|nr:hypothetical protein [Iamia majanohamensis]WCO67913.1 hypothetical protein PO878_04140 [Iamia majanohamensis]